MTTKNIVRSVTYSSGATLFFAVEESDMESFRTFAESKNLWLDGYSEPFSPERAAELYRTGYGILRHYVAA